MHFEDADISLSHALWTHYTVFDDLAGMRVEDIHQDLRGFIWVATADGGVSRFDGVHFDNLTCRDGLPHLTVMAMAETADGRLWFGTLGGGLAAYDGHTIQVYTTADGLPSDEILGLRAGPDNTLLVTNERGVATLAEGRVVDTLTAVAGQPLKAVYDLAQDSSGRTWLADYDLGVISTDGRRLRDPDQPERPLVAWKFAVDGQGDLWLAPRSARASYLYHYDPNREALEKVTPPPEKASTMLVHGVRHLRFDSRGWLWVADRGALVFDGRHWQRLEMAALGMDLANARLTYEDREGNVWIGFWGGGLACGDLRSVCRFTEADGLPNDEVHCLAEDRQETLWIGTAGGLARQGLDDGAPEIVADTQGNFIFSLWTDPQGQIWAGGGKRTVYRCAAGAVQPVALGEASAALSALTADREGRFRARWIASFADDNKEEAALSKTDELAMVEDALYQAIAMLVDRQGRLWMGLHGNEPALYSYDGQRLHPFTPAETGTPLHYVYAFCETADGTLWIGTGTGLLAYRDGQFRLFTTDDGLPANTVLALAAEPSGRLWIGTSGGGAARFDGQTFHPVRLGDKPADNVVHSLLVSRRGPVWLGTERGLVRYQPGQVPPQVVVRQVDTDQSYREPRTVRWVETVPQVRIVYQGISFRSSGRQLLYRHRLAAAGEEAGWSALDPATETVYYRLPPGAYRFEVQALDRDGLASPPAAVDLQVEPDPQAGRLRALEQVLGQISAPQDFIGRSQALRQCLEQAAALAALEENVLILGETGTGKGLMARTLHQLSPRRHKPFLHLNCGSLPEGLIAGELFGHERGAFTGASSRHLGRFELAEGGTLFLDEIGDLPLPLQAVLLQVLETREIQRLGSEKTIRVNVRVIAATNRDLRQAMAAQQFRADLYFRLANWVIEMPPLRRRREDIPALVDHFAQRFAKHLHRPTPRLAPAVLERLQAYAWPGNIRELEHLVQRAVVICKNQFLRLEDLALPGVGAPDWSEVAPPSKAAVPEEPSRPAAGPPGRPSASLSRGPQPLKQQPPTARRQEPENVSLSGVRQERTEEERALIEQALQRCRGVIYGEQGAARLLGLAPENLRSRMRKYSLKASDYRVAGV